MNATSKLETSPRAACTRPQTLDRRATRDEVGEAERRRLKPGWEVCLLRDRVRGPVATAGGRYLVPFDTAHLPEYRSDLLVVGSGIAGLVAALLAAGERSVTLATKATVTETNTWWAQGGIAGAVCEQDSVQLHLFDTLRAGVGLCDEEVVRAVVEEAPDALEFLSASGVRFDQAGGGKADLHLEGGHSHPRVLHAGDATGAEIQNALSNRVRSTPGIALFEERFLVDLLTEVGEGGARCVGGLFFNTRRQALEVIRAGAVVLATGGCGQIYRVTTNPTLATGDGLAAAWRAGAEVTDLEFVQFHPTAFDSDADPKFLITEALRGEGARLLDHQCRRFMQGAHPLGELAPRDVVSREIEKAMARSGLGSVGLDARHLGAEFLQRRFSTIWKKCSEAGYDLSRDVVPVAPAAHYMVGGVRVDVDGRTSLAGLFASGEVAASGLHGANRLASNSLLEGLVLSRRIVRALAEQPLHRSSQRMACVAREVGDSSPGAAIHRRQLQSMMSNCVAVTRSDRSLARASEQLGDMTAALGSRGVREVADFELRNLLLVAELVLRAADFRTESRGAHYRLDFPLADDAHWKGRCVWSRGQDPRFVPINEGR